MPPNICRAKNSAIRGNRNYPGNWHAANQQTGPGPFPLSEPETRAVGDFFRNHPNIAFAFSHHTYGGDILRPRTAGPDLDMNPQDLDALKSMGRRGQEITGYKCVSIFESFTRNPRRPSTGSFLDFTYDVRGIMAMAVELWDLDRRSGIPKRDSRQRMNLSEDEKEEDDVKILKYVDKELAGEGWHPWTEFNHPQLGKVELGGGDYEFTCALKNVGYLPTSSSQQALAVNAVGPLKLKVIPESGVSLVSGKEYEELPHLPGWSAGPFGQERKIRLVFRAEGNRAGTLATVRIESERAGSLELKVTTG